MSKSKRKRYSAEFKVKIALEALKGEEIWLGEYHSKIIISPEIKLEGITAWGFKGLIPDEWIIM